MFGLIKKAFEAVYVQVTSKLRTLFAKQTVDQETLNQLEKIRKIISKQLPDKKVSTLLTIDTMLGQNSLFKENTAVDGIVLTKMDGTGKGGIVFSITEQLKIPIAYISFGEKSDQLAPFNANEYLSTLLG